MIYRLRIYAEDTPQILKKELKRTESPLKYHFWETLFSNHPLDRFVDGDGQYFFSHKEHGYKFFLFAPWAELEDEKVSDTQEKLGINVNSIITSQQNITLNPVFTGLEESLDNPSEEAKPLVETYKDVTNYLNQRGLKSFFGMQRSPGELELVMGKNHETGAESFYDPNNYTQNSSLKMLLE